MPDRPSRRPWLLATASAVLLTLCYPPFALAWLGWVALTPLLLALDGATLGAAAGLGWLTGTVGGLGVTGYWIARAGADYFGLSPLAAVAFSVAVNQVFVAPFFALFGVLVAWIGRRSWRLVLIPAALVVSEAARASLVGNAWALLGHSQSALVLLQIVDITGVAGLSFLLAFSASLLAALLADVGEGLSVMQAATRRRRGLAALAVVVALVAGYGAWRLSASPPATAVRVALVQGAISNEERRDPGEAAEAVQRYVTLTYAAPPAPLVVWPENAIAVFPETNATLLEPLRNLLERRGGSVLSGAPRAGERAGHAALYNSAYLFTAGGAHPVYDKRHLLPFVERQPLRPDDDAYVSGGTSAPVAIGAARAGILICYEVIDPALAREAVAAGADLLINLSNDSWFAVGAGPAQHYAIARFRAVENGVALLRATNSGISGAFDPTGREIARLPADVAAAGIVDVPLRGGGTFYTRHGDWFVAVCAALVLAAVVCGKRR